MTADPTLPGSTPVWGSTWETGARPGRTSAAPSRGQGGVRPLWPLRAGVLPLRGPRAPSPPSPPSFLLDLGVSRRRVFPPSNSAPPPRLPWCPWESSRASRLPSQFLFLGISSCFPPPPHLSSSLPRPAFGPPSVKPSYWLPENGTSGKH
eukprot:4636315-Pyramimonas_sp.AAC.1